MYPDVCTGHFADIFAISCHSFLLPLEHLWARLLADFSGTFIQPVVENTSVWPVQSVVAYSSQRAKHSVFEPSTQVLGMQCTSHKLYSTHFYCAKLLYHCHTGHDMNVALFQTREELMSVESSADQADSTPAEPSLPDSQN